MNFLGLSKRFLVGSQISDATRTANSSQPNNKRLWFTTSLNGYRNGGAGVTNTDDIDRFNFSAETITNLTTKLSRIKNRHIGLSNSGYGGYILGGCNPTIGCGMTDFEKFNYTTELTTQLGAGPFYINSVAPMNNPMVAGYVVNATSLAFKYVYATETYSHLASDPSFVVGGSNAALHNAGVAGYSSGRGSAGFEQNKLSFITETQSAIGNSIDKRYNTSSISNTGSAGYIIAGNSGTTFSPFQKCEKITFSNDTNSAIANIAGSYGISGGAGIERYGSAGYSMGGSSDNPTNGGTGLTDINKINFSNDANSKISATISFGCRDNYASGLSNNGVL